MLCRRTAARQEDDRRATDGGGRRTLLTQLSGGSGGASRSHNAIPREGTGTGANALGLDRAEVPDARSLVTVAEITTTIRGLAAEVDVDHSEIGPTGRQ